MATQSGEEYRVSLHMILCSIALSDLAMHANKLNIFFLLTF